MSDSQFKKAISEKMNESTAFPEELVWSDIDTALAEKRAEKRRRRVVLVFLFPLLAGGLFFLFGEKTEADFGEKAAVFAENVGHEKGIDTKKGVEEMPKAKHTGSEFNKVQVKAISPSGGRGRKARASNQNIEEIRIHPPAPASGGDRPSGVLEGESISQLPLHSAFAENPSFEEKEQLDLFSELNFQPIFLKVETQSLSFSPLSVKTEKESASVLQTKKIALIANFESNQLAYCFDEKANHFAARVEAEYRITPRLAAGIGLGFHQTKYQFEVNETEHLAAFGNTNKYPDFYKINRAVETIGNDLRFFTGSVSATFYQPLSEKWATSLGVSQDFVFKQNQKITYAFFNSRPDLEITENASGFDIGMTGFRLGIHRSFGEHFTGGIFFNRYITSRTIGIERQYYHGFGGGLRVGHLF